LALRRRGRLSRLAGAGAAGLAAAALWDDLEHASRWFRRALLPHRPTWNVVAEAGDPEAERTVVLVAHHDAAHSGLVFHPALGRIGPRLAPRLHERSKHTIPILYGTWLGPVMIFTGAAVGSQALIRAGMALGSGTVLAMADIGARPVVPGANDNLAAVGTLIALAASLRQRPVDGLRVLLVSTGSEESFSEGMIVLEGEGMLRMHDYPLHMRHALAEAAARAGVAISRGIQTVAATDALIALRAGYPVATLASIEQTKLPLNYHWPSDTPHRLRWRSVEEAIRVCDMFLRIRARGGRLFRAQSG
jgi:hypothetical protein